MRGVYSLLTLLVTLLGRRTFVGVMLTVCLLVLLRLLLLLASCRPLGSLGGLGILSILLLLATSLRRLNIRKTFGFRHGILLLALTFCLLGLLLRLILGV